MLLGVFGFAWFRFILLSVVVFCCVLFYVALFCVVCLMLLEAVLFCICCSMSIYIYICFTPFLLLDVANVRVCLTLRSVGQVALFPDNLF